MKKLLNLRGHSVFRPLSEQPVVADFGGNNGDFSVLAVERWNAKVFAVEANPHLAANFPKNSQITILHAAIAATDGTATFSVEEHSERSSLREDKDTGVSVRTVSLGSFLDEYDLASVDVAKVDIEGAEIEMFMESSAATLQKVAQFTVEFHDHHGMPASDKTPASIVKAVVTRMKSLGFDVIKSTHFGHGDVVFINRELFPISRLELMWHKWVLKYAAGSRRFLKRMTK